MRAGVSAVGCMPLLGGGHREQSAIEIADWILGMTHRYTLAHVLLSDRLRGNVPDEFRPPIMRFPEIIPLQILSSPPIASRGCGGGRPALNRIGFFNPALIDGKCGRGLMGRRAFRPPHTPGGL